MKTDRGVWLSGRGAGTPLQLFRVEPEAGSTNQKTGNAPKNASSRDPKCSAFGPVVLFWDESAQFLPREGTVISITAEVAAHQCR